MPYLKKIKNYYKRAYKMGHYPSLKEVLFSKKKKVFYCGFLGDRNYGDELVYQAAKKLHSSLILIPLKRHMPLILRLGSHLFWPSISGVIIGGGTLIKKNIEEDLLVSKLIKTGKPFFIHGSGATEKITAINLWNTILASKPFGGVRGPLSVNNIANNFKLEMPIIGDAAFCLYSDIVDNLGSTPTKQILINFGTHNFYPSIEAARYEIELFINSCLTKGIKVCFLPFHTIDKKIGEKLQNKYPEITLLKIPSNYNEAIGYFKESDFAIGERLHFNILSMLANCPYLSINYDKKHEDFLWSCEATFAGIAIEEVSFSRITSFFDNRANLFDWDAINLTSKKLKNKQISEATAFSKIIYS